MANVRISKNNRITLPREIREHLGVGPGDELLIVPKEEYVVVMPRPKSISKALAGSGKGLYGDAWEYLKRERQSWKGRER